MTFRQRARQIIQAATCILVDSELYAHDPRTPFKTLEDALTDALERAVGEEREACAQLVLAESERLKSAFDSNRHAFSSSWFSSARTLLDTLTDTIRERQPGDSVTPDPFGFSYDQD